MATLNNYQWIPDYNNLSYDETCIVMFGMDAEELEERNNGKTES